MLRYRMLLWLLALGLCLAAAKLPTKPANDFLNDYANVINIEQTRNELRSDLKTWNATGKSRLFVVTVSSLGGYGLEDVVSGSKAWFDTWGLDQDDVLFLFSVGDRKAWVQVGSDWGPGGEARASQILKDVVMPPAGQGDYSLAVFRGTNALHRMIEGGTDSARAASAPLSEKIQAGLRRTLPYCEMPWQVALAMFGLGFAFLILGVLGLPRLMGRPAMLAAATLTITATAFSAVALPVFGIILVIGISMFLPHHHHCHSWFGWGESRHDSCGVLGFFFDGVWGGGSSDSW